MPDTAFPVCPLFVYGTLLVGESAHRLIEPFVAAAAPGLLDGAELYSLGPYPIAVAGYGQVFGELLWLRAGAHDAALRRLDAYETFQYVRECRAVRDLARYVTVDAWVYLGRVPPAPACPRILGGDWRTHRRGSGR